MQKINKLLYKYILKYCTPFEVMFVLYLAYNQDYLGRVTRIYYKDVAKALGCSEDKFYKALYSLDQHQTSAEGKILRLKLIQVDWSCDAYGYWNITLLHNDFRGYEDKYFNQDLETVTKYPDLAEALQGKLDANDVRGYHQIKDFIFSPEYAALKPNAKLLGVLFMRFNHQKVGKEKLMSWLNIKKVETLMSYLDGLKKWYHIDSQGSKVTYTLYKQYKDKDIYDRRKEQHSIEVMRLKNKLITLMRGLKKHAKDAIEQIAKDIIELYINYKVKIMQYGADAMHWFSRYVWKSIDEYGMLEAAYINKLLQKDFPEEKALKEEKAGKKAPAKTKSFNNFKNRVYDPKELEKRLFERSRREGMEY